MLSTHKSFVLYQKNIEQKAVILEQLILHQVLSFMHFLLLLYPVQS